MKNVAEFIMNNPYLGAIGIIVGIVSGALGLWWGFRKKKKEVAVQYENYEILGKEIKDIGNLSISYNKNGEEELLEELNFTTIEIINTGNMCIRGEDIASKKKIVIKWNYYEEERVYGYPDANGEVALTNHLEDRCGEILKIDLDMSDEASDLKYKIGEWETNEILKGEFVEVDFEYLEKGDKLVLKVLHTFKLQDVQVEGKIIGGKIYSVNQISSERKEAFNNAKETILEYLKRRFM